MSEAKIECQECGQEMEKFSADYSYGKRISICPQCGNENIITTSKQLNDYFMPKKLAELFIHKQKFIEELLEGFFYELEYNCCLTANENAKSRIMMTISHIVDKRVAQLYNYKEVGRE